MSGKSGGLSLLVGLLVLNSNIAFSQSWTVQFPNQRPSGRFSFGMAYDSARREVLIFGGREAPSKIFQGTLWQCEV